jgi:hypothetical protein
MFICKQTYLCLYNFRTSKSFYPNRELSGFMALQLLILWDGNSYRRINLPLTVSILFKILQFIKFEYEIWFMIFLWFHRKTTQWDHGICRTYSSLVGTNVMTTYLMDCALSWDIHEFYYVFSPVISDLTYHNNNIYILFLAFYVWYICVCSINTRYIYFFYLWHFVYVIKISSYIFIL